MIIWLHSEQRRALGWIRKCFSQYNCPSLSPKTESKIILHSQQVAHLGWSLCSPLVILNTKNSPLMGSEQRPQIVNFFWEGEAGGDGKFWNFSFFGCLSWKIKVYKLKKERKKKPLSKFGWGEEGGEIGGMAWNCPGKCSLQYRELVSWWKFNSDCCLHIQQIEQASCHNRSSIHWKSWVVILLLHPMHIGKKLGSQDAQCGFPSFTTHSAFRGFLQLTHSKQFQWYNWQFKVTPKETSIFLKHFPQVGWYTSLPIL